MIHRDIKGQNVLLTDNAEVKLGESNRFHKHFIEPLHDKTNAGPRQGIRDKELRRKEHTIISREKGLCYKYDMSCESLCLFLLFPPVCLKP